MRILGLIVAAMTLALAGAAASQPPGPKLDAAAVAQCAVRGGKVVRGGMMGAELCVVPFKDAGKACTAKSQCMGQCLLDRSGARAERPKPGAPVVGQCQATSYPFGCRTTVEDGKVGVSVCVD